MNNNVNVKKNITDFGTVWFVSAEDKSFKFAVYMYSDDSSTIYLSNVFVNKQYRGKGLGNVILQSTEKIAHQFNTQYICLKCKKNTSTQQWYIRHNYKNLSDDEQNPSYIWMIKKIS